MPKTGAKKPVPGLSFGQLARTFDFSQDTLNLHIRSAAVPCLSECFDIYQTSSMRVRLTDLAPVLAPLFGSLAKSLRSALIFLDRGIEACLAINLHRPWEPRKYASAAEQDAGVFAELRGGIL